MTIYDFTDSGPFLRAFLTAQPKRGHGLLSRWGQSLGISTTHLSQIVQGKKTMSLEIAEGLGTELGLGVHEMDYLLLMVETERAGTPRLRARFRQKLEDARTAARHLKNRVQDTTELSADVKAQYYASWLYSGVRNLAVCPEIQSVEDLAARLRLPRAVVAEIVEFLVRHELLTPEKKGWSSGVKRTYLPPDSPLVRQHHENWRQRSIQHMDVKTTEDLFYTSPMSLSADMAKRLRKTIVDFIAEFQKQAAPTDSEVGYCLNIDWFEY